MWRSSVAHTHGVRGVAGSNPVIPTKLYVLKVATKIKIIFRQINYHLQTMKLNLT